MSLGRSTTARTTIKVAAGLIVIKLAAFLATGSAGILGSTLDSVLDLVASGLVLWAVLAAERPADADHPWGHGKAESLAGLFQSGFILLSGIGLAIETARRAMSGEARVEVPWVGVAVMVASTLVTIWWVRELRRAARETDSPALEADSHHYASDVLMNAGVAVGLVLSFLLPGVAWPDLLVGGLIALLILNTARIVFLKSVHNLMDRGLEPAEALAVLEAVARHAPRVAGFHDLRTRRSGRDVFLEVHLDVDRCLSFVAAHEAAEEVAAAIEAAVPRSRVTVHADPL
ncbi:MAG TPA: cation diffusion facilitator family transporter [Planctomycetota bacterium]